MNKILELREKRAKTWENAKNFLDNRRNDNGWKYKKGYKKISSSS